jgi:hypothetical protein
MGSLMLINFHKGEVKNMAIIQSRTLRSRLIQQARQSAVDVWLLGATARSFENVPIREVGADYIRVNNNGINALVNLALLGSLDNAAGTGVTPQVTSENFRSRIIEFARQFTVDIYIPGVAAASYTDVTIREVGSNYIRFTTENPAIPNVYLPFPALAAIEQNGVLANPNIPVVTSRDFRSILIELAASDTSFLSLIIGGRSFLGVQIEEVQSEFVRINNAAQTKIPILDIVSIIF